MTILGGNRTGWSYSQLSFGQTYFNEMTCAVNREKDLSNIGKIGKVLKAGFKVYSVAITGDITLLYNPETQKTLIDSAKTVFSVITGVKDEPKPASDLYGLGLDVLQIIIDQAVKPATIKATENYQAILYSPVKYVLDEYSNQLHVTKTVINGYINEIIKIVQYIRSIDETLSSDYDLRMIKTTAINYLEDVIRLQLDSGYRRNTIEAITK